MFNKARITLTLWYLLIIMVISISFSVVIYQGATIEIQRALSFQRFRIENPEGEFIFPRQQRRIVLIDPEVLEESKRRIALWLAGINVIILVTSGTAGFFLAGKTLKPIKKMMDDQSRFISDASHELRTPLTVLKSAMEVNLRDKNLTLKEAKKLIVENIEEVDKLQSLSDGLLQLAQFQKNGSKIFFETLSLLNLTQKSIQKIEPLAKKKNLIIKNTISNLKIEGNKDSLEKLFLIILDNAVKYSPAKKTIKIYSEKKDHTVSVYFEDQGIGIEEKDLPHIFDRFYRADSARAKTVDNGGYGLGLTIAKNIVDFHHGQIKVESKPGKGSVFTVSLPLKQTALKLN